MKISITTCAGAIAALALFSAVSALDARQMSSGAAMPATSMAAPMMANEFKPYTKAAHQAAMDAGKTTIVFFHAPWCPVCRAQEPKLMAHLNGGHKDIVAFKVDYDSNVDLRKAFSVTKQSTVILYKGTKEVARLSYMSDDASINELFAHAMPMVGGK